MRASTYAQALWELSEDPKHGKDNDLVRNFLATVERKGHAHLFPKIARSLERISKRQAQRETIEVASAEALSEPEVATLLKSEPYKHAVGPKHRKVVRRVDPTLIGGAVVRTSSARIDGSHKRALLELYQSLISG